MSQDLHFVKPAIGPAGKLVLLGIVCIALLILDNRYAALQQAKSYVATALSPLQWVARKPVEWARYGSGLVSDKHTLLAENARLRVENINLNMQIRLQQPAVRELGELKALTRLQPLLVPRVVAAEIVSNARNPQSGRFLINRGSRDGVRVGDPVSDEHGLLGQITLVQPAAAEVTLISSTQSVIPAMVSGSGVRTLVYGRGGSLDLRYFPVSAELNAGDLLVTSGMDSIYPAGIPVAQVIRAERNSGTPYYRAVLEPASRLHSSRYVLVIPQKDQESQNPTLLETSAPADGSTQEQP